MGCGIHFLILSFDTEQFNTVRGGKGAKRNLNKDIYMYIFKKLRIALFFVIHKVHPSFIFTFFAMQVVLLCV